MATRTLLRNISGTDDVRAVLDNSTARRSLSIGTNWTKVRIGIRFSFEDSGADVTGTPFLSLGLCSGLTNPVNNGSALTDHFLGLRTVDATWTRTLTTTPPHWLVSTYAVLASKRVGTTWTNTTGTNNFWYAWYIFLGTEYRQLVFLDITKGSPNFTLAVYMRGSTTNPTYDYSRDSFINLVTQATPPNENGNSTGTSNTVAVDEATDGYLDSVNIAWDRSVPKMEISDLAVVRFS